MKTAWKVKDVIAALQKVDPEAPFVVFDYEGAPRLPTGVGTMMIRFPEDPNWPDVVECETKEAGSVVARFIE